MSFILGDSHANQFRETGMSILHIENITIWSSLEEKYRNKVESALTRFKGKMFYFLLGEVDCRFHIGQIAKKENRSYEDVIKTGIDRYEKLLLRAKEIGVEIGVISIPPTGKQDNEILDLERGKINIEFNRQLKLLAEKMQIPYMDIHTPISDEFGRMKPEYLKADCVHAHEDIITKIWNDIKK